MTLSVGPSAASAWSSSSVQRPACTTNSTASTPASAPVAVLFIMRLTARGVSRCRPGVSTNTNCAAGSLRMPSTRQRVVCGLGVTMLTFLPTKALSSDDLPTFGRPTIATSPERSAVSGIGRSEGAEQAQQRGGRALLGLAPAAAGAVGGERRRAQRTAHAEGLLVVGALDRDHAVLGQAAALALQALLQAGLGVLEDVGVGQVRQARGEVAQHQLARGADAGVEVDRTDQRLVGIGQDGFAAEAAALELAGAEREHLAQAELGRHGRERAFVHQ